MSPEEQIARLEKRLLREKAARQEAESLLEGKSRELYLANIDLQDAARLLEEKVELRTAELKVALARAEAGVRAKNRFMAVVSHELRTPMNGVLGMAELLAVTPLNPVQQDLLKTLQDSGADLMALISDLLDLAELESGRLQLKQQDIDTAGLFYGVITQLRDKAELKGLKLQVDKPEHVPWSQGDAQRLRQVLQNLLSNALKFTLSGQITVQIRVERQVDDMLDWQVSVADTGIGMTAEQLGRLFQAFEMMDPTVARHQHSTGMGLVVCRHLMQAMGGDITVVSESGVGSCFTMSWRAKRCVPPGAIASPRLPVLSSAAKALRVLVVEDNPVNQKLIVTLLARLGLPPCLLANNGEEGMVMVQTSQPDLVLMDMQMPVMDGLQSTTQIRKLADICQPDIVALTANAFDEDRECCLFAGMDDFLSKPLRVDQLALVLERAANGLFAKQRGEQVLQD